MDQALLIKYGVSIIYYAIILTLTILGGFGIYVVVRFGQNRATSLTLSVIFAVIFLQLLLQSFLVLQTV